MSEDEITALRPTELSKTDGWYVCSGSDNELTYYDNGSFENCKTLCGYIIVDHVYQEQSTTKVIFRFKTHSDSVIDHLQEFKFEDIKNSFSYVMEKLKNEGFYIYCDNKDEEELLHKYILLKIKQIENRNQTIKDV